MLKKPDFFILGGPKCGTTSLASWLGMHNAVYMPPIKEPNYYDTDVRSAGRLTEKEYRALFDAASAQHRRVGEASTGYLRSSAAVPNILSDILHDLRFIVSVRNPIEMAVSLHSERLKEGIETEKNFEKAWRLQNERAGGKRLPAGCFDRENLLYGPICSLGTQLEYQLSLIDRNRLLVIVFDDIKKDPRSEYIRILNFLDLEDDEREFFAAENRAQALPGTVSRCLRLGIVVKRRMRIRANTGVVTRARRLFGRELNRSPMPEPLLLELRDYFREDVHKLGRLIGRDLSSWLNYQVYI